MSVLGEGNAPSRRASHPERFIMRSWRHHTSGGCFTNISLSKIFAWNYTMPEITFMGIISSWNFVRVPKASTHTKFQLEILVRSMISAIQKFRENNLQGVWNVSETTPCSYLDTSVHQNKTPFASSSPRIHTRGWVWLSKIWSFGASSLRNGQNKLPCT